MHFSTVLLILHLMAINWTLRQCWVPRPGDNDKISALTVKIKAAEKRISQTAGKINYVDPAELDDPPSPITKGDGLD